MSYQVLALKYRPHRFEDLVGQEHVTDTLRNAIASERVAHAFLFTGIRGVGKTTAARLLAKALNCQTSAKPTAEPCGECSNCKEITDSRSIDVAEIDGASNRGIDSIRELTDNVRYRPAKSRYRIYIVDEAHMVTKEGFNALLKTLEEPPPHVKFIFATTAVDKFPETIVSRCQRYDFKRISQKRITDELRRIAAAEKISVSDTALYAVGREAEGSMRDAESLLERLIAFCGDADQIDDARVADVLGVADRRTLYEAAEAVLERDAATALGIVDRVHDAGRDLERFSRDLVEHWRNLVVASLPGAGTILRELPEADVVECRRQAALRPIGELQRLFRIARSGDEEIQRSPYPRLVLEMTMVRLATLEPVVPIDEALERLEEVARGIGKAGAAPIGTPSPKPPSAARPGNGSPQSVPPPPAKEVSAAGDGRSWPEFLGFVQTKKLALYLTLSHVRMLELGRGTVVLGAAQEHYRQELGRREVQTLVEELATEFFGAPTKVRVQAVAEEAPAVLPAPSAGETLDNPAVKAAINILGGEVREVRTRR